MMLYANAEEHPDEDALVSFVRGFIDPEKESLVDLHLRRCLGCQADARDLQDRLMDSRKNRGFPPPSVLS